MSLQSPSRAKALSRTFALLLAFAATDTSFAAPVTTALPAVSDTTIRQQQANQNRGIDEQMRLGWAQTSRALVRFDSAAITAAVGTGTLVSAHLELDVVETGESWPTASQNVDAHRVTAAWTETGATWSCGIDTKPGDNRADCTPLWNGGTFLSTPTATVPHTKEARGRVRFDVTADVTAFLAGTANQGWLLKKANEALSGRIDYVSREGAVAERAPRLVVVVEPSTGGDQTPPSLTFMRPTEGEFVGSANTTAIIRYADAGSGIDTLGFDLLFDGLDQKDQARVTSVGADLELTSGLGDGPHTLLARIRDIAGNLSEASVGFILDRTAPEISILSPLDTAPEDEPSPLVEISFSDALSGVEEASLQVLLDGQEVTGACSVSGGGAICASPVLASGSHNLFVAISDRAGNQARRASTFTLALDVTPPSLLILSPAAPVVLGDTRPKFSASYADAGSGLDLSSIRVELDGAAITSGCLVGPTEVLCQAPTLVRGPHTFAVSIVDLRGNAATATLAFSLAFPVEVAFTSPAPDTLVGVPVVAVSGTVVAEAVSVEVNGVPAALLGGQFTISELGLHDGVNHLVAVARDAAGNVGTAVLRVFADSTAPQIAITYPPDGGFVTTPTVSVTGLVNDLTLGTISETEVTVTVNGRPATVANRSFVTPEVSLAPGVNTLVAEVFDRVGRRSQASVEVTRLDRAGFPALLFVSGDTQTATIGQVLTEPLVVKVVDGSGAPSPGSRVLFRVVQGNGVLGDGSRLVSVLTDSAGEARASWRLGSRAGVGADRVVATAVGVIGEVAFHARTLPGPPAMIHVVSGNNQSGAVGSDLPGRLVAAVFDAGANPVAGVPVSFQRIEGDGELAGGAGATMLTDASGLAATAFRLGLIPGLDNHLVQATFPLLTTEPATFKASAFVPGDPAATELLGLVLDNQGEPVPGVTLRVRDTTLTTLADDQGRFRLSGVPVGRLFLIADASTTSRPGQWASLEFELFTVAGVVNALERPIHVLPLDLPNGVFVDETHGGTITLPELPGLRLEVAPGSVSFPGGGRSGLVSVTAVHADKIPMTPGGGMQPRLIVTIQPAGARFDPPAPFSLPNVDALAPGTVTELFSFDHDLGAFVAVGTGTVSEDGLVVRSDPGFGILEAGWHCGAQPTDGGAAAPVDVTIPGRPGPIILCRDDQGQPLPTVIFAFGAPPRDGEYQWETSNPVAVSLDPVGGGLCPDQPACPTTALAGTEPGYAAARVTFRCQTTGATDLDEIDVFNPGVEVTAADPCGHQVQTQLRPIDPRLSGELILRMIGADGSASEFLRENRTGGDYTDEIDFDALPTRVEFTHVEAEWRCGGCAVGVKHRREAHFLSLGRIRHTQYNCPDAGDATCEGGGNVNVCFTDAGCAYDGPAAVPQEWLDQVTGADQGTGCGSVPGRGNVQIEEFCLAPRQIARFPPPAPCTGLAVFRAGGGIVGSCGGGVGNTTVAVDDGYLNAELPCGSRICILVGAGAGVEKTVADRCPGCGTGRIDNFSDSGECGILDFAGGAVTLRLYD